MYKYDTKAEKDYKIIANFKRPPKGIIIFDSFNNEWFPSKAIKIDNNQFNLRTLKDDFHREFGGDSKNDLFMPWHYQMEFTGKDYFATSTRPITYKSLIPGYEDYISVCIMGDSTNDIYPKNLYKIIAHQLLNPLHYIPGWKLNPKGKTEFHNLGEAFVERLLEKEFR